jgi:hypothetical protein
MATKNKLGKARKPGNPYLIFIGGPFGPTEVLKSWQADNSKPYARWFVAVNGDLGDSYAGDIARYETLDYFDPAVLTEGEARAIVREARRSTSSW